MQEDTHEHFALQWYGKEQAKTEAFSDCKHQIIFEAEKSLWAEQNEHILLEADNLVGLKLLHANYEGRIKLIYIDPPYNTGEEQLYGYSDKFVGKKELGNNSKKQSYALSQAAWLSMMYPRMLRARDLMTKNGVLAVSIDNREVFQLKLMLDEIFGHENFIGELIWVNRTSPNDTKLNFATTHEYVLFYAKHKQNVRFEGLDKDLSQYKNPDNDPKGPWMADNPSAASGTTSYRFPIKNPYTGEDRFPPKGRFWAFSPQRVAEWTESGKMKFHNQAGKGFLLKKYLHELKSSQKALDSVLVGILTAEGTRELKSLYEEGAPFKYPKPTALVKLLIQQLCGPEDWVLDFFAGSGSTAQAVLDYNSEAKSHVKFICVQSAEPYNAQNKAYAAQFQTVADLTRDRITRVCERINAETGSQLGFKYWTAAAIKVSNEK